MTEEQKKAAVILAVTDVLSNGPRANPSVYWGVPFPGCNLFDRVVARLSLSDLDFVLDRLVKS
jgi:hypothetical protein